MKEAIQATVSSLEIGTTVAQKNLSSESNEDMTEDTTERGGCGCGSGLTPYEVYDARGIYCGKACDKCENKLKRKYRKEIFEDPEYYCDEDID